MCLKTIALHVLVHMDWYDDAMAWSTASDIADVIASSDSLLRLRRA